MLFLDAGGELRVAHLPAGEDLAIGPFRRVGEIVPRIFAVVSLRPEPCIVGEVRVDLGRRMLAVVTFEWFKAAFGQVQADLGLAGETQPCRARLVGDEMGLARHCDPHPRGSQIVS